MFVLAFNNTTVNVLNNPINNTNNRALRNRHTKYFLPRVNITNYNVLIDGRNFYYQSVNPADKQRSRDVPWRSPKGPNVRDIHETFRGLLRDQHKNWWFNEKSVF